MSLTQITLAHTLALTRLQLTAEVVQSRHVVLVDGIAVPLTFTSFELLVRLVLTNCPSVSSSSNRVRAPLDRPDRAAFHTTISRLRRCFDEALGQPGAGASLVRHEGYSRYRLYVSPENITVDEDLRDFADLCPVIATLLDHIRPVPTTAPTQETPA